MKSFPAGSNFATLEKTRKMRKLGFHLIHGGLKILREHYCAEADSETNLVREIIDRINHGSEQRPKWPC